LLVNLLLIAATVGLGVAACHGKRVDPHLNEAALAIGVALAASAVGAVVLGLGNAQPPTPAGPSMSALLAMVSHLGVTLMGSAVVLVVGGVAAAPFAFWVLGLFWATMIGLAGVCVRSVRAAAAAMPPSRSAA
jgi:hypothetical protein